MSFEGYYQRLCKEGHYWCVDTCGYDIEEDELCLKCGTKYVWENLVDVTNGSYEYNGIRIDGYIALEEKERTVCDKCNSTLELKFKIPKRK